MISTIATGFVFGFASSLHCVGMCGPLALIAGQTSSRQRFTIGLALYHLGKLISYLLLALMVGMSGVAVRLAGIQELLSIVAGISLLGFVLARFVPSVFATLRKISGQLTSVSSTLVKSARVFRSSPATRSFLIGFANGFLPCGFLYIALLGATLQPTLADSLLFMASFGVGTIPALTGVAVLSPVVNSYRSLASILRRVTPALLTIVAVALILRGLGLGIPYLSPQLNGRQFQLKTMPTDSTHCGG